MEDTNIVDGEGGEERKMGDKDRVQGKGKKFLEKRN